MKLSDYARREGVRYETAWRWYRDGKIKGHRVGKHTIMVDEDKPVQPAGQQVAVYARVSSAENKSNLDSQAERLVAYSMARGYQIARVVKEVGSGVNDARPKFLALLEDLAKAGGGRPFVAADAGALDRVFITIDSLEKSPVRGMIRARYREEYGPFVVVALGLLVADRLLSAGRLRRLP